MKIPLYQIDAFTGRLFGGNPAAVCPLEVWLPVETMQAIAAENNLSETAFFVENGDYFDLRWFTPTHEVDLCGHATLATAHLLIHELAVADERVNFETRSGRLTVSRGAGDLLVMDFPALTPEPWASSAALDDALDDALGAPVSEVHGRVNCIALYGSESLIRGLKPDLAKIAALPYEGVIVTAKGDEADFVSRYFAPKFGIPEDPVTGSNHCELTPFWAERLGKTQLVAHQVSSRFGELRCELKGDRVFMSGRAVKYLEGVITL